MVVARDHARQVLEVRRELLELDHVVWLNVVPAPHELIEGLLLTLLASQHLGMPLRIVRLAHLLQCYLAARDLLHPLVGVQDRFVAVLVEFAPEVVQQQPVGDLSLG